MALALYRKYRPTTFAEVIGQDHVTGPLIQALRTGRLNHAYLFSGPRGCGKTSSARILARSLNCEKGPTPDPCGVCPSCQALTSDGPGSIDVIEIDAASHGGVDDARDLRERALFAPVSSRFKVYVIDEAHMVSSAGFNALLKLVEEPPEYVKFVFATTEPDKVLGTIRSRTHHYPFRLIPPSAMRPFLEGLCEREGVSVESPVFPLIMRAGGGSVRDTLSLLDQLIAGAGSAGVTYSTAVALLGVTDAALIDEICDGLASGNGAAVYATIARVTDAGHEPRRFASDLLDRLRDLIILRNVPEAVEKGLLDYPADQLERMRAQAEAVGSATLSRMADLTHEGLIQMRGTTAPRLLLELICARMLLPGAEESTGALLQRLERLERSVASGVGPAVPAGSTPAPASAPVPAPSPVSSPPAARPQASTPAPAPQRGEARSTVESGTGPRDSSVVVQSWDRVLGVCKDRSKRTAAVLREASVSGVEGNTLILSFQHAVHAGMLTSAPDALLSALSAVLGGTWVVRCDVVGASGGSVGQSTGGSHPGGGGQQPARPREETARRASAPAEEWPSPAVPGATARQQGAAQWPQPRAQSQAQAQPQPGQRAAPAGESPSQEPPPAAVRGAQTRETARRDRSAPAAGPGPGGSPQPAAPSSGIQHEGFAPGDEPLDDGDGDGPHQSPEEQAVRLLTDVLDASKLSDG